MNELTTLLAIFKKSFAFFLWKKKKDRKKAKDCPSKKEPKDFNEITWVKSS